MRYKTLKKDEMERLAIDALTSLEREHFTLELQLVGIERDEAKYPEREIQFRRLDEVAAKIRAASEVVKGMDDDNQPAKKVAKATKKKAATSE